MHWLHVAGTQGVHGGKHDPVVYGNLPNTLQQGFDVTMAPRGKNLPVILTGITDRIMDRMIDRIVARIIGRKIDRIRDLTLDWIIDRDHRQENG